MPTIRPLTPEDFDAAYRSFLAPGDARNTRELYEPMFDRRISLDGQIGVGLWNGDQLVGMLGTIVSERNGNGQSAVVCNLHSWNVLPEYRGYSLLLMRSILKRSDWTLTDFTPTPAVVAISQRLGFQALDGRLTLLSPVRRTVAQEGPPVEFLLDRTAILERFKTDDPTVRAAINDRCLTPVLAVRDSQSCLALARLLHRDCRPHCRLAFLSDAALFAAWSVPFRRELLERCGGEFVAVETRLLPNVRLPASRRLSISSPQLIRPVAGTSLESDIDCLRSELQFTGQNTLPGKRLYAQVWRNRLRDAVRQWLPF